MVRYELQLAGGGTLDHVPLAALVAVESSPVPFRPGDRVRFRANGVRGRVIRNAGSAVNTRTGNDVIVWRDPEGSECAHDAGLLEFVD